MTPDFRRGLGNQITRPLASPPPPPRSKGVLRRALYEDVRVTLILGFPLSLREVSRQLPIPPLE